MIFFTQCVKCSANCPRDRDDGFCDPSRILLNAGSAGLRGPKLRPRCVRCGFLVSALHGNPRSLFPKLRKNVHKKYHPNDYSNQKGGVLTKLAGDNLHLFEDHKGVTATCSVLNFVIIIFNYLFRRGYKK